MSLSSKIHSALRAALSVADAIDPSGRFRAILHLLRCCGVERLEEILSLSVDEVAGFLRFAQEGLGPFHPVGPSATDPCRLKVGLGGLSLPLDGEGRAEVSRFLIRRNSYRLVTLSQSQRRGCRWYILVRCTGGCARRSLGTTDEEIAKRRATRILGDVTRTARERDPGWLFPSYAMGIPRVTTGQFRIWLNQAVGRQGGGKARRACRGKPLFRKAKQRRARDRC